MALTHEELRAIVVVERISSVLSLLGASFIILTFLSSPLFHKPINRLVFYSSFANIMTNVGTLISRSAVHKPNSAVCQTQGFLIHWFLLVDPLFTFMMALNVYLTFFRRYNAEQLRRMDWKYLAICYGVPFVPAFVYLFVKDAAGVRVYGSATIWCWVSEEWNIIRIPGFYGPVWLIMVVTTSIYLWVGVFIFRKRRDLKLFSKPFTSPFEVSTLRTTEVHVTTEMIATRHSRGSSLSAEEGHGEKRSEVKNCQGHAQYSVTIETGAADLPSDDSSRSSTGLKCSSYSGKEYEVKDVAWSYTRAALCYFIAMVVTWIPSGTYRLYSLIYPDKAPFGFVLSGALVLPLQGFWNVIIWVVVSQNATRDFFYGLCDNPLIHRVIAQWRRWRS